MEEFLITMWLGNELSNRGTGLPDTYNRILNTHAAELSPTRPDCPVKGIRNTLPRVLRFQYIQVSIVFKYSSVGAVHQVVLSILQYNISHIPTHIP
ncbi:hypothetical protein GBA52_020336 [Prunus armeniaca]|nr:hypothetical protein GBA52_020336 [Prunus armeniaca]